MDPQHLSIEGKGREADALPRRREHVAAGYWRMVGRCEAGEGFEQQTPQALAKLQKAEIEKWWSIIKAAGIRAE
jgi:hypothetical protein